MRGLWGRLCVVLLLVEMKRGYEKKKNGEDTKVETGRGRRELTVFFREKKDILLDLMDGMIGGVRFKGRSCEGEGGGGQVCLRFAKALKQS
jgi:hypothetical protein